jgi:hypothetical protein
MRPADTSAEAWEVFLAVHRRMTPEQKLRKAIELSEMGMKLAQAGLRERYPAADEREIFLRAVRQRLGQELFEQAYGACLSEG